MRKMLLILFLIVCSCTDNFTEKEVIGYYVPTDYNNTYDTIELMENGKYHRKVYDKRKKLILNIMSKYELRNGGSKIYFNSYFLNLDRDLEQFPELANDTTGGAELIIEKASNTIQFCTGYLSASLPDQNCYHKLK